MNPVSGSHAIELVIDGETVDIDYAWVGSVASPKPLIVFLHEGLGSISMWREFPAQLCSALGCPGLVYSRSGYGNSAMVTGQREWVPNYLHGEALDVLPALLRALAIDPAERPLWLLGHSDGGSIALIHAAHLPGQAAGLIVLAPHIMVEDVTIRSIERARDAYIDGSLRSGLARHHADPDATFWRWNRMWLSPEFRSWSIEDEIGAIRCPVLAIQGKDDPYGTMEQIYGIERRVAKTRLVELDNCAHSSHRDQPERLIAEIRSFLELSHVG